MKYDKKYWKFVIFQILSINENMCTADLFL